MLTQTKTKARLLASALALILLFSLAACSGNSGSNSPTPNTSPAQGGNNTPTQSPTDAATPEPAYVSTLSLSDYGNTTGDFFDSYANMLVCENLSARGEVIPNLYDVVLVSVQTGYMGSPPIDTRTGELYMDLFNFYHHEMFAYTLDDVLRELPPSAAKARDNFIRGVMEFNETPFDDHEKALVTVGALINEYEQAIGGATTQQPPATSPSPGTTTPPQSPSPTPATLTLGFDLNTVSGWEAAYKQALENNSKAFENWKTLNEYDNTFSQEHKKLRAGWEELWKNLNRKDGTLPQYDGYYVFGDMKNGKPDGLCYLVLAQPPLDDMAGFGYIMDTRYSVTGTFKDGKLNGYGYVSNIGERTKTGGSAYYTGFFKDGKYHGLGFYRSSEGVWKGEWENGAFTGYGNIETTSGNVRTMSYGYFENGAMKGPGLVIPTETKDGSTLGVVVSSYRIYAVYDGDKAHVLDIEDITELSQQAHADANQMLSDAINRINKSVSDAQNNMAAINAQSRASLEKFKAGLAASQSIPKYIPVPNYSGAEAFDPIKGGWGSAWTWVLGD